MVPIKGMYRYITVIVEELTLVKPNGVQSLVEQEVIRFIKGYINLR